MGAVGYGSDLVLSFCGSSRGRPVMTSPVRYRPGRQIPREQSILKPIPLVSPGCGGI